MEPASFGNILQWGRGRGLYTEGLSQVNWTNPLELLSLEWLKRNVQK